MAPRRRFDVVFPSGIGTPLGSTRKPTTAVALQHPGFVRVVASRTLAFPSYDGKGMFKSVGNILVNPHRARGAEK